MPCQGMHSYEIAVGRGSAHHRRVDLLACHAMFFHAMLVYADCARLCALSGYRATASLSRRVPLLLPLNCFTCMSRPFATDKACRDASTPSPAPAQSRTQHVHVHFVHSSREHDPASVRFSVLAPQRVTAPSERKLASPPSERTPRSATRTPESALPLVNCTTQSRCIPAPRDPGPGRRRVPPATLLASPAPPVQPAREQARVPVPAAV
jgi:hypothetical protein